MILAHFHKLLGPEDASPTTWIDRGIVLFVAEKDRAIFAFLFGVSFAVILRQLKSRGQAVAPIFLRRLIGLYLIGFAVEALTHFSILRDYAWWGLALLAVHRWPTRSLLVLALLSAAAFSLRDVVDDSVALAHHGRAAVVAEQKVQQASYLANVAATAALTHGPDYGAAVTERIRTMVSSFPSLATITPDEYLALFILGLLAVRIGLFENPGRNRAIFVAFMIGGVAVWATAWALLSRVPLDFPTPRLAQRLHHGFGVLDEQYLAFTVIGGITLLLAWKPAWEAALSPFAWVGRLALSNYLLHAVVIDVLSADYGFGLTLSARWQLIGAILLFVTLVLLSRLWLVWFRYGPAEWLWRSFTYLSWQPLRLARRA